MQNLYTLMDCTLLLFIIFDPELGKWLKENHQHILLWISCYQPVIWIKGINDFRLASFVFISFFTFSLWKVLDFICGNRTKD